MSFSCCHREAKNKAEKRVFPVQKEHCLFIRGVKWGSWGASRALLSSAISCRSRFAASGRRMQNKVTLGSAPPITLPRAPSALCSAHAADRIQKWNAKWPAGRNFSTCSRRLNPQPLMCQSKISLKEPAASNTKVYFFYIEGTFCSLKIDIRSI
jgi:hypothetical protein